MLCEKYKATNYRGSRTESSRSKKPKKVKKKQENYIMTHRTQPKVHEKQQGALSNTPESARVVASFLVSFRELRSVIQKIKEELRKYNCSLPVL